MEHLPQLVSLGRACQLWQTAQWPHFFPEEFACRHCGESYVWDEFLTRLSEARQKTAYPFQILSGHRCALHNARVGGAPLSQHLKLATDISLHGHSRSKILKACQQAGFTGFGFYQTFLHVDLGRKRYWFGSQHARTQWQRFLD